MASGGNSCPGGTTANSDQPVEHRADAVTMKPINALHEKKRVTNRHERKWSVAFTGHLSRIHISKPD